MAEHEDQNIFAQCTIAFVPGKRLSTKTIAELKHTVPQYGGSVLEPGDEGRIPIDQATHIIANTIDFEEYSEAETQMVPVVTSEWITASLHKNRQAQIRPYSPDPRMIFARVNITCADIPMTDKEAIIGATMALGGMESKDLTKLTTHICALSMDHPKCQQALDKRLKCKIVLPHWFDDCFKLGKRIDEGPYLLPDPEILRLGPSDEVKIPSSQHLEGATASRPDYAPLDVEEEGTREKLIVFAQRKVMLSWDLSLGTRLRKILESMIRSGGGEVVDNVDKCNMFICQYRDGEQYVRAAQAGRDVGSLSWLYHLITKNEWTSPLRRLLHYPIPRGGIPGFENMRITLSNYGGEARIYLENLVTAAGATYTKTMRADNTHLITARMSSEKCDAAQDWSLTIVNHMWLEESYAKCEVQSISVSKYTHFPPRTNLGEIIGQTPFDESQLRAKYYPGPKDDEVAKTTKRKRVAMAGAHDNLDMDPVESRSLAVLRDTDAQPVVKTNGAVGRPRKDVATPVRGRHVRAGKENDTPSILSTGSRSAKANALNRIQDLAPDIALYEKERRRSTKDHGPWGGKRAADQIDKERGLARSSSPTAQRDANDEAELEDEEETGRPAKKHKPSLPPVEMRIVLTGFKRWVADKNKEDVDRRKLRAMGIQIVQDGMPCDYLAAPQMVRTMKFLRTLARGPMVIDSAFIDACLDTGKLPDVRKFPLKDVENEKRFGVKLQTAIARARQNKGRLLWNVPIYCTAEIRNGPESYKVIAEANGAIFKLYRARGGTTIKPTTAEEDGGRDPEPVYLLTSNTPQERALLPRFEEMARKGHMEPRIVISDWLLDVAMSQELGPFKNKYLVSKAG